MQAAITSQNLFLFESTSKFAQSFIEFVEVETV
jgi:hypothetical protein